MMGAGDNEDECCTTEGCCGGPSPSDGTDHWARFDGSCWVNCPACASDGPPVTSPAFCIARGHMRADGIVTGKRIGRTSLAEDVEEALRRLEEGPTMTSFSPAEYDESRQRPVEDTP